MSIPNQFQVKVRLSAGAYLVAANGKSASSTQSEDVAIKHLAAKLWGEGKHTFDFLQKEENGLSVYVVKQDIAAKPLVMIRTIEFADHGQDFLQWDIDVKGRIVESRGQNWMWTQYRVINHQALKVGGFAIVIEIGKTGERTQIKYAIEKIGKPKGVPAHG